MLIFLQVSTGIAGFALAAPEHAPYYLDIIKAWNIPVPVLFTLKSLLVWPFFYHTVNGVRHLVSALLFYVQIVENIAKIFQYQEGNCK